MDKFFPGQSVCFREHSGRVNFICEEYITLTIKEYCIPSESAWNCKRNPNQVNLLIFREDWHEVLDNEK